MNERKKGLLGILILLVVFVGVSALIYFVSLVPVTAKDVSSLVPTLPSVRAEEIQDEDGKFITLTYPDVDLSTYVVLGDYRNMTITEVPTYEVSEADIQDNIQSYIEYYQRYLPITEGTITVGDPVTLTYSGSLDGVEMEEYVATEKAMRLGYAGEPAGFTNALDGMEIGQDLSFDVNMPDDWTDPAVAGKTLQFTAHVHNKLTVPELTDDTVEFITDNQYHTKDEFVAFLTERIAAYYEEVRDSEITAAILDKLVETSTYGVPDHKLLAWYVSVMMRYYQVYADASGITVEDMIASIDGVDSLDDLLKMFCEGALEELPYQVTLTAVAQDLGLTVDPANEEDAAWIESRKQYIMETMGYKDEAELAANYSDISLYHDVLNQKALRWLMENVKQVPAETAAVEPNVSSEEPADIDTNSLSHLEQTVEPDGAVNGDDEISTDNSDDLENAVEIEK